MKARLGAGRANLQRTDNQINRHDVADIPDDRAQVKHLVKLEPAGDGVRLAQREAHGAGDVCGPSACDEYGWRGADRGSRPKLRDKRHRCQSEHDVHGGEHPIRGSQPDDMQYRADGRGHPDHREVWAARARAEREKHGCIGACDNEEDIRIVDAAQHTGHRRASPRHDVQERAVAEQQHDRCAVHRARRFDGAGRCDADQHDGRRDAQRQGGEVQPSTQSGFAIAECVHGDDAASDRFQCCLGLAVVRLRGPVSRRRAIQCGHGIVHPVAGVRRRGRRGGGRRPCRAGGSAHIDHLAVAGAFPAANLRYRNVVRGGAAVKVGSVRCYGLRRSTTLQSTVFLLLLCSL